MQRSGPSPAFHILIAGIIFLSAAPARSAAPQRPSEAALPRGSARSGGVKGSAVFDGVPPAAKTIRMNADPACMESHPRGMSFQPVRVGKNHGLADVFVYVKKGLEGRKFTPRPGAKLVLDQRGCWYFPRVSGAMVGEPVEILNSDPTMHNVDADGAFNRGMPAGVKKIETSFQTPRVMLDIRCDVHPWMRTYVGVLDHPYFAVTNEQGAFEIRGLPPGKYTLEAWHETLGAMTQEIAVGKLETKARFKFQSSVMKQAAP